MGEACGRAEASVPGAVSVAGVAAGSPAVCVAAAFSPSCAPEDSAWTACVVCGAGVAVGAESACVGVASTGDQAGTLSSPPPEAQRGMMMASAMTSSVASAMTSIGSGEFLSRRRGPGLRPCA